MVVVVVVAVVVIVAVYLQVARLHLPRNRRKTESPQPIR